MTSSSDNNNLNNNNNNSHTSNGSTASGVEESSASKSSRMKDAFVSFVLFLIVTALTHGIGGPPPFVLPTASKANEGVPAAAAPPNLRIQLAPPPRPFFGRYSAVDDFYGGDVYAAFAEADLHENALLFYYAPWDADSRATRKVSLYRNLV